MFAVSWVPEQVKDELQPEVQATADKVVVGAFADGKECKLQVTVFNGPAFKSTILNHSIELPDEPLCSAWIDSKVSNKDTGNFIAIGSLNMVDINIWDLELVGRIKSVGVKGLNKRDRKKSKVEPFLVLGGKNKGFDSHTLRVAHLAWNKKVKNYLASASNDKSVKLWDLVQGKCQQTSLHHEKEVHVVEWNEHIPEVLLSGSADNSVVLMDIRHSQGFKCKVLQPFDSLAWDPHHQHLFLVGLENGILQGCDVRVLSQSKWAPIFSVEAHRNSPVSAVSYSPTAKLLATGTMNEGTVKLWDVSNQQPLYITSKNLNAGDVFSLSFSEDNPFLLAIGGEKHLKVWDTTEVAANSK